MTRIDWIDGAKVNFTAGGKTLEGQCFGSDPSKASTILMLHEGLGCLALWRDFPRQVAEATGLGVFVWSRAGYGQSDPADLPRPIDYMEHEALDALPDVLNVIGFQRGVLLGHSDGASIAAIYAGSIEDFRIRGLVLIAPHFFTEPVGLQSIAEAKTAYEQGDLKAKLAKYHKDPDNTFRGWNEAWLNPEFEAWNIAETIDYWRVPTLAIQGRDDQYGTLAQIREIENRAYSPVDVAILADCRHSPHTEQPEKTLAAVSEFVERLERIENEAVEIA